jgi:RNA polymerase sigma-70 factor (ECF subfamily)
MTERPSIGTEGLSLQLLVLRCQAGDERAFAKLMDSFGGRTLRYLRGLVGQDAEDVQQEVWLTVYRGLSALVNPGAFRTWLFRTTRHRAIDFLRRKKREMELIDDVPIEAVDLSDDAGEELIDVSDIARLDAALAAMPPPQREVLLLRYRDALSYAEIALVVGCPIGTVRTRLYHARRRLNERLNLPHKGDWT